MPLPKDNLFHGLRPTMEADQLHYVDSIIDYHLVFSNSPAGSGKTVCAVGALKYLLDQGEIDHIYYIFSPVYEKVMGFRTGNQPAKEFAYTGPVDDALMALKFMPQRARRDDIHLELMKNGSKEHGWISPQSHVFLRGRTLDRVGVIFDEAQNWTKEELKKGLTRPKDNCHVVVIGHTGQIDIPRPTSGFQPMIDHFEPLEDRVRFCPLTEKNFRGWISAHADKLLV